MYKPDSRHPASRWHELAAAIGAMLLWSLCLGINPLAAAEDRIDRDSVASRDHYVPVQSSVPSMQGMIAQLYVRERSAPGAAAQDNGQGRVVLFIHGAGTPAEVAFDVP